MTFRTGKNKSTVVALLDMGTQCRLYVWCIGVVGDLLELVNGNQARLVSIPKIFEYLVKRRGWIFYVAKSQTPCREVIDVVSDF